MKGIGKNVPSIHMPRWASRLTLRVTDVRVQRVQDISQEDAISEGLEWVDRTWGVKGFAPSWCAVPKESFKVLWDSLNAKRGYGWDINPWVAVLTFEVEKRNIDNVE